MKKSEFAIQKQYLLDTVSDSMPRSKLLDDKPILINIGGPSASGKSALSLELSKELRNSKILHVDRYLVGAKIISKLNHSSPIPREPYLGGLNPFSYDTNLLLNHLISLKSENQVNVPIYDHIVDEPSGTEVFEPHKFIILEGLYALNEEFLSLADVSIYVESTTHERILRKIIRTGLDYKRKNLSWVIENYLCNEEPSYKAKANYFKDCVNIVVRNQTNILLLSQRPEIATIDFTTGLWFKLIPRDDHSRSDVSEEIYINMKNDAESVLYCLVSNKPIYETPIEKSTIKELYNYYKFIKIK